MECAQVVEYLSDYLDGNLSEALKAEAQAHIASCRNCRVVLDTTQQTILLYRERGRREALPPRRHAALYAQLEAVLLAGKPTAATDEQDDEA
jgi:predicted anti-sigma-YlaC factor YlaD